MNPGADRRQRSGLKLEKVSVQPADIVVRLDPGGRIVKWNRTARKVLGYNQSEVKGKHWQEIFFSSELDLRAVLSGKNFYSRVIARSKNSGEVEIYFYATSYQGKDGTGIVCIGREASTITAERKLALVSGLSSDGIVVISKSGKVIQANPAAGVIAGRPVEEIVGTTVVKFIPPERWREAVSFWRKLFRFGANDGTIKIRGLTGEERTLQVRARVFASNLMIAVCRDITEQEKTAVARRFAEELLRNVFDVSPAALVLEELDGTIIDVNEQAIRMLARPRSDFVGRRLRDLVPPDVQRLFPELRTTLFEKGFFEIEIVTRRPDGKRLWVLVRSNVLHLSDRNLILTQITDITGERERLAELKEHETRLRVLMEQVPALIWTTDRELRFTSALGSGLVGLGAKPGELLGKNVVTLFGGTELPVRHRQVLTGETAVFNFKFEGRIYQARLEPFRDIEGGILGVIGVAQDVTEQEEMELIAKEAAFAYQTVVETAPVGIGVHQDGKVVMVNAAGARLLGYNDPAEMIGINVMEIIHPDDRALALSRIRAVLEEQTPGKPVIERFRHRDGSYVEVEVVNAPFIWSGRPAVLVIVQDIRELLRLTAERDWLTTHLRTIMEHTPSAIAIQRQNRIVYANAAFARLFGYQEEEILGKPIVDLVAPHERERITQYAAQRSKGMPVPEEYEFDGLIKGGDVRRMKARVVVYEVKGVLFTLGFISAA